MRLHTRRTIWTLGLLPGADRLSFTSLVRRRAAGRRGGLWLALGAVFFLALASTASAEIFFDSAASNTCNCSTLSWSHTVGNGNNRILVVGLASINGNPFPPATLVTYGGLPLTRQVLNNGSSSISEIWTLLAPPTGPAMVVVTYPDTRDAAGGSVSFFGVDQTTPIRDRNQARAAGAAFVMVSTSVATLSGDLVIDAVAGRGAEPSGTPAAGQTLRWSGSSSNLIFGGGSTQPGASGSTTMAWNLTPVAGTVFGALSAISLIPAPPICTGTQQTFNYTGQVQTFVVPAGVTQITIDAAGAQGGGSGSFAGGSGARLVSSFAVTPGETLNIVVGGAGSTGASGGGGGGSFVYRGAPATGLLIAAAGGGGASRGSGIAGSATTTAANGQGSDGGTGGSAGIGGNGGGAGSGNGCAGGGGGGLLTNGVSNCSAGGKALANGAAGGSGGGVDGGSGGFGGGGGGMGSDAAAIDPERGGGGGGGYNGGGGGTTLSAGAGAGGGGGSFSASALLFGQSGAQTGNGVVSFCYIVPPSITKAFDPTTIQAGGTSTITFTLSNSNSSALTNANFTDTLTNMSVASTTIGGTCSGVSNNPPLAVGATLLNLTVPSLAAGSCTITIQVTSNTPGTQANQTSGVTTMQTPTAGSPSNPVMLNVVAPPTITKSFSPTTINPGANSQLTLSITNPASNFALTNLAVTDNLPTGVTIAVTPAPGFNTCGGSVTGATAGSNSFSLTGGTLAAGLSSCQIQLSVTSATPGPVTNTTTNVTATGSGVNVTGGTASATLNVNPILTPSISKTFGAATIPLGGTTSLSFTINNPNPSLTLNGVAFTDNLPAGLIVATPNGLSNTCGGTVAAVSGTGTISLSGGTVAASSSCTLSVNVTGTTPGAKNNSVQVTSSNGGTGNTATAAVTVGAAPLSVSIADPFGCTGPGDVLTVTVITSNPTPVAQTVSFTATLPANLVGLPGTGTATVGTPPTVNATSATYTATLAPSQSTTVTYQVQVGDAANGAQLCIATALTFGGQPSGSVTACATINCTAVGPGAVFPSTGEVSDQKAGSVLFYNLYSSSIAAPNAQNTRVSITNIHPQLPIAVHLFFVDGATCSIADSLVCLTPNQTASFLASDIDPGTTGYIIAVASDLVTGCPISFNYLIGDEYVKLSSGHAANLAAEGFAALAGGLPTCNASSVTTVLNFDGTSYNRAPRVLAASNIPSRADGNDTLIVLNRVGGSLAAGASTLGSLFGILYDDAENPLSFTFNAGVCQFRSSLSSSFPRTAPRFEQFIPAGRSGWAKFYSLSDIGLLGAQLNFNANAGTAAQAFNQGHNMHKLTLTSAATLTIPIFPPNC